MFTSVLIKYNTVPKNLYLTQQGWKSRVRVGRCASAPCSPSPPVATTPGSARRTPGCPVSAGTRRGSRQNVEDGEGKEGDVEDEDRSMNQPISDFEPIWRLAVPHVLITLSIISSLTKNSSCGRRESSSHCSRSA
eukprot:7663743-Heterocapsa_arctica.AAC.1